LDHKSWVVSDWGGNVPKKLSRFNLGSELATIYPLKLFVCSSHHRVRLRVGRLSISSTGRISRNAERRPRRGRTESAIYCNWE